MNTNEVIRRAVSWPMLDVVGWNVRTAVHVVYQPVNEAVYWPVYRAARRAVYDAVYWAARRDPLHPSLATFLTRAGAEPS